jgi:hypothetical protein
MFILPSEVCFRLRSFFAFSFFTFFAFFAFFVPDKMRVLLSSDFGRFEFELIRVLFYISLNCKLITKN